jgi:hypothetical protein
MRDKYVCSAVHLCRCRVAQSTPPAKPRHRPAQVAHMLVCLLTGPVRSAHPASPVRPSYLASSVALHGGCAPAVLDAHQRQWPGPASATPGAGVALECWSLKPTPRAGTASTSPSLAYRCCRWRSTLQGLPRPCQASWRQGLAEVVRRTRASRRGGQAGMHVVKQAGLAPPVGSAAFWRAGDILPPQMASTAACTGELQVSAGHATAPQQPCSARPQPHLARAAALLGPALPQALIVRGGAVWRRGAGGARRAADGWVGAHRAGQGRGEAAGAPRGRLQQRSPAV